MRRFPPLSPPHSTSIGAQPRVWQAWGTWMARPSRWQGKWPRPPPSNTRTIGPAATATAGPSRICLRLSPPVIGSCVISTPTAPGRPDFVEGCRFEPGPTRGWQQLPTGRASTTAGPARLPRPGLPHTHMSLVRVNGEKPVAARPSCASVTGVAPWCEVPRLLQTLNLTCRRIDESDLRGRYNWISGCPVRR